MYKIAGSLEIEKYNFLGYSKCNFWFRHTPNIIAKTGKKNINVLLMVSYMSKILKFIISKKFPI